MIDLHADVAIIGSGFGGTLTALILDRVGLRTVLIDRASHPRFALGESSTPMADLLLQHLAQKYDLPRLLPLAEYGSWQTVYPELACGLKRGFSYFKHQPGEHFTPRADHANELLVAASADEADADTHWFRADFDHFFVREAQAAGIPFFDRTELTELNNGPPWMLRGVHDNEPLRFTADFLIDASGEGNVVARALHMPIEPTGMRTNSRALYGHFTGVAHWSEFLASRGGHLADHPFCCDDAALHHVLDGAWMWVLRFNNGVTSAGFMFDAARYPFDGSISPEQEWQTCMQRFPSVERQFEQAQLTQECGSLRRTKRLQRRAAKTAGQNWALLPLTAYALDALHSTGNAHTLCGVERLTGILEQRLTGDKLSRALQEYDRMLQGEIDLLDEIVHGCYAGFSQFELMTSFASFYFAAATVSEHRRRCGRADPQAGFLLAHDPEFRAAVRAQCQALLELQHGSSSDSPAKIRAFAESVSKAIRPYNIAGLCDPVKKNMYPFLCAAENA